MRDKSVCMKCIKERCGSWLESDQRRWLSGEVLCRDADDMPVGTIYLHNPLPSFCYYITEQIVSGAVPPDKNEKQFYDGVIDSMKEMTEDLSFWDEWGVMDE